MDGSNVFITMSDETRLAASLYLPETEGPWPVLLEARPYRKDDLATGAETYRRLRDEGDYAVCRVDLRGTGTSEGIAAGEYLPQEHDDLVEVIEWLTRQDWSTGAVGMFGTSYSGFNTIQTAMRQPAGLKGIIPIYMDTRDAAGSGMRGLANNVNVAPASGADVDALTRALFETPNGPPYGS